MLVRTIIALVSSPFYGVLIALATLPILVIGGIAMGLLSIASLILPLILIALSFVLQAAVYAQSARYAASMTGLKSLMQQPDFFRSVGRSLAPIAGRSRPGSSPPTEPMRTGSASRLASRATPHWWDLSM